MKIKLINDDDEMMIMMKGDNDQSLIHSEPKMYLFYGKMLYLY